MSNNEVKRFKFINDVGNWSRKEAVLASDHDRIVAELKAQLEHSETKVAWLLRDNEKNVSERDAVIAKQAKVIEVLKKEVVMAEERNNEIESAARESNMINIKLKKDLAVRDTEIRKLMREAKEYFELAKEAGLANLKLQFEIQNLKDQIFYLKEKE